MKYRLLVILGIFLLAGCSSTPGPEQPGAAVESGNAKPVEATQVKTVQPEQLTGTSIAELKNPKSILYKRSVYFDFNQYVVKDQYRPLVEAHARFLMANPNEKMLIQGNADERGSREYNLALGQKRADAVKNMLELLGVKDSQIESVSLGKEKPRCTEHTEACWAQNRRADMLYNGEY